MFIEKNFRYYRNPPPLLLQIAVLQLLVNNINSRIPIGIPVCAVISDRTSQHTRLITYTFIIQEADGRWEKETIRRNDGECSVEGGAEED